MNSRVAFGAMGRGKQVVVTINGAESITLSVEEAEALARYLAVAIDLARINRARGEAA